MVKTKANEREFQGQVIAWIKKQIDLGGLTFKNATNDSGLYGLPTVKFPDVLLTLDFEGNQPFCGWELKTPTNVYLRTRYLEEILVAIQAEDGSWKANEGSHVYSTALGILSLSIFYNYLPIYQH